MGRSSVLLLCIVAACTVWAVHGRTLEVSISEGEQEEVLDMDVTVDVRKLPGICWACKWALNKVKKLAGSNSTVEKLTAKLNSVCDQIGLLKSLCRKFVKTHLGELVEELTTTDDVRTICVNVRACKSKELMDASFNPDDEDFPIIEVHGFPE
ncbi:NK-lysin tandem duplicate 4 [Stegastes partitus]|uniref:NK-lysin tandem duplicate 4 n=1 Tax=Stegastes partitus TaxID=144197 RepID=A0A9Y4JVP9_9TELE|nr:PREDICTED: antimicrobial peptide NK-lysin-like [Stegastes partitus]